MRPSSIALAVGLLAAPLSLMTMPGHGPMAEAALAPGDTINGKPLTDAPVSSLSGGSVGPADRVAGPGAQASESGPVNSTPFSDAPTGTLSGGSGEVAGRDRVETSRDGGPVTPNLGR